jgi:hypothetical protein
MGQIRAKKVREGSNFQVVDGRTRIGGGVALVLWPKDRSFLAPGEPKIGIYEDKVTNRGHPHEQTALANTVISSPTYSSEAASQMCKKKTSKKWRCE